MRIWVLGLLLVWAPMVWATPPARPGDVVPDAELPESPTLRAYQEAISGAKAPKELAGRFGSEGMAEVVSRLATDAEPGTVELVIALREVLRGMDVTLPAHVKALKPVKDADPISAAEAGRVWGLVQHLGAATGAQLADGKILEADRVDPALRDRVLIALAEHAPSAAIRWQVADHVYRGMCPPVWMPTEALDGAGGAYESAVVRRVFNGMLASAFSHVEGEPIRDDQTMALAAMAMGATLQQGMVLALLEAPTDGGKQAGRRLTAWAAHIEALKQDSRFRVSHIALDRLAAQSRFLRKKLEAGFALQLQIQHDGYHLLLKVFDAVNREDRNALMPMLHPTKRSEMGQVKSLRATVAGVEGAVAIVPTRWHMVGGLPDSPELEVDLLVIDGDGQIVKRAIGFALTQTDDGLRLGRPD